MKNAPYGRIVFALSAILFGIIALMWQDADTWQGLFRILKWPMGAYIGNSLMVAQIAGGFALLYPPTVRIASKILVVVFGITTLVCIAGIFRAPGSFFQYYPVAEQLAMMCGVLAIFNAKVARIGLGLSTVMFTLGQVVGFKGTAALVPAWIPFGQNFWAIATTVAFGLATIALLVNVQAKRAAWLEGLMIAGFGLLVWVPTVVTNPSNHNDWSEFAINFLIAGAAWLVSASLSHESRARS